ncbi:acyl carrier protein [Streptomyces candidus]|uniref:Acyl carrier protein n=1 Tax=Streptomyces candidus TaxID=67283 RepID=A0A7X0LQT2_9ACTN|nr:acyl carrier protein [Streptomyces candidus]MBB6436769.1 acyl carrier protein [Streptomyces candidus]GHH51333.1 acyl carrier protein [Streptomyces candidus]
MQTTDLRDDHSTRTRDHRVTGVRDDRITEIVCDRLEIEPGEIAETDRFVEEHGADSLALIGVLAALEKEFRVTIDQNEMPRMAHLAGVRQVLAETAGW